MKYELKAKLAAVSGGSVSLGGFDLWEPTDQ